MHSLGWEQCPSLWGINIEGVGTVPDNVANWTIKQKVLSGFERGNFRDVTTGAITPFSTSIPTGDDGPVPGATLQQVNGTTTMYYIDSPGPINQRYGNGNQVIDSVTFAVNFEVDLCNANQTAACTITDWYVKVVVTSGGQLNTSQSSIGLGSVSLNF
jgi:hypothetical protein